MQALGLVRILKKKNLVEISFRKVQSVKKMGSGLHFLVRKHGQVCPNKKIRFWRIENIVLEGFWDLFLLSFSYTYLKEVK